MTVVSERFRPALRRKLDDLVNRELPELLSWVHQYGNSGATLIPQPDLIWSHPRTNWLQRADGSYYGELPLWTTEESPSDLSVEVEIDHDARAVLTDLHAL